MSTFSIPRNIDTLTIDLSEHDREIRNKAIDEFVEAVKRRFPYDKNGVFHIELIAEQLKEGGTDEM